VHLLAAVLVPFDAHHAATRPLVARDAAAFARLEMLLFRFQQPQEWGMWGNDPGRGFMFDWWALGGRWNGWGREVRKLMAKQQLRPAQKPIPRFLERNAVWTEDLGRVRLTRSVSPAAVVTPYGQWEEGSSVLPIIGKARSVRERRARSAWRKKIRRLLRPFPDCLAIAVDYHC
jgi:hypothetical protein